MKTVQEQIVVMQAYADGKTVRRTNTIKGFLLDIHIDDAPMPFNWQNYEYDIVQEPIVRYMVVVSQNGSSVCEYDRYEDAKSKLEDITYDGYKIIKLVQDMDFNSED